MSTFTVMHACVQSIFVPVDTIVHSKAFLSRASTIMQTGNSDMIQKMNNIRDMQERLTMKHFEIDQLKMTSDTASGTGLVEDQEDTYLIELTQALEKLGSTIQSLHSKDSMTKKSGEGHSKKVTLKANFGEETTLS